MFTMIINSLFSLSLFLTGGYILSTNLKLHHYSDDDYKEIFYLKNKKSITKHCIRHSKLEDIKKSKRYRPEGGQETIYKVSNPYPIQHTPQHDTFNIQRKNKWNASGSNKGEWNEKDTTTYFLH